MKFVEKGKKKIPAVPGLINQNKKEEVGLFSMVVLTRTRTKMTESTLVMIGLMAGQSVG